MLFAGHAMLRLLVLVTALWHVCPARVLFRNPTSYNTFMRQLTLPFEKAKVETLGDIFKRHVQQLRHTQNKQVELVFLIDSSGTVGRFYFYEEIRFVRNLLADFTVDVNSTRVSVITFSSPHKIYRHIDYLSQPGPENHKCRLLNEDIQQVDYTPGGTHTLGAFLEAEKVLRSARPDAAKAIFLLTDGYSNGGDPRPVANKLKQQGVKIFTFGIRDGFVWELQDMASEPKNETCYILDSFEEFEALAKRALHSDLHIGSYIEQPHDKCGQLCSSSDTCCHEDAACSCGTYTGKYECLCKPGHYGTGRGKTGCKPCPPGTYKNHTGLGDISACSSCPDEHHTTSPAAVSVHQCVCMRGYRSFGMEECTVFRCPELSPPKYGYFVNNKCNNVYNAACGLRCQHGYELRGSSLRICQDDGNWSGQEAECILKTCPSLPPPKNGHMICSSDDFSYSSVCRFTCNGGYQLVGSRKRTCLAIAFWTGIATRCREITCPPLVAIKDGSISPPSCTAHEVVFGSTCQISCSSGYMLKGPHTKQCTPDGTWMAAGEGANQCIDETPPVLSCPKSKEVLANEFEETTQVFWTAPVPVDNSGFRPVLTSDPVVTPGSRFPIGVTEVTYKAEDLSQNVVKCHFKITVIDKTPPRADKCVSPPPFVAQGEEAEIIVEPPVFSDNSGRAVEVMSSRGQGQPFTLGTTVVTYTAFDSHNNNSTCTIEVKVVPHLCILPDPPVHGNASCMEGETGVTCRVSCIEGYAFAIPPADQYFCDYNDGHWTPKENFPFPDCAVVQISNDILQPATITLTGDVSCKDGELLNSLEENLKTLVKDKLTDVCGGDVTCSVGSLKSVCEDEQDFNKIQVVPESKRRKRSVDDDKGENRDKGKTKSRISYKLMLTGSVKQALSDTAHNLSSALMDILTSLQREARKGNLDLQAKGRALTFSQMTYDLDLKTYRCPEGSVRVNDSCVNCPVGTFYHVLDQRCVDCPRGTYQPREGHTTCLRCADNMSTVTVHARSEQDCKALCLPGTWSANGLEPCETCHIGYYQSDYSARACHACADGTTTYKRGSRREEDCAVLCPPGHASETGLSPCLPCPRDSYQPSPGQVECVICPADGYTIHTGVTDVQDCIISPEAMELQADTGDNGVIDPQTVPFNPCFEDPCQNGGTCTHVPGSQLFTCTCDKGFTGTKCEHVLDLCEARPCHNRGTCTQVGGAFTCDCMDGFTGTNCEVNIDDCIGFPCQNKGVCVDGINSFTCNCPVGYAGPTCANVVNDCDESPCQNGGTCTNSVSSFQCACLPGYTGETCEIDMDECMSVPCQNGGSCQDLPGSFRCECKRGYTGLTCEKEIDECALGPCQNQATCHDLLDDYKCVCPDGFTGKKCEKALSSQYQLDFSSPTIMDYAQLTIAQPLTSATVSFWIKTSDTTNQGTTFSYAVPGEPNAFTVTDYQNLILMINGETVNLGLSLNDGHWHHVVITWSSFRGDWKVYRDGLLTDQGYNLSTQKPIPGKGVFIVGQEQDDLGGGFSPSETFVGSLTRLEVWSQELSLTDIERLRLSCDSFHGNIIAWADVQESLKGNVRNTESAFCQDCPTPSHPLHGTATITDTKPGSGVSFQCKNGYSLAGNPQLKCLVSAHWDNEIPECAPINCGHPGSIRNGYVIGRDFSYNKRVRFQCNPGFEMEGPTTLYCTEWGDWDNDKPKCVEIQCQLPALSENTISSFVGKKVPPGTVVEFSCKPGSHMYTLHDSVICQRDGSWDKSVPSCDPQKCGYPPAIENGEPFTANPEYNVGDVIRYQCDYGYEFNPEVTNVKKSLTCLPSGEWETNLPVCGPIKCPDPPVLFNAVSSGEGRSYQSLITYNCIPGFKSDGNTVIECEETREWSRPTFKCIPVDCGAPSPVNHGVTVGGDVHLFDSVVTYRCDQGYFQDGPDTRRCQENGTWSGKDPSCLPVTCGEIQPIPNGEVTQTGTTFPSTATFSCLPGYELKGFAQSTCEASGNWVPDPPTCKPRPCPAPQDIKFGSYTASGRFVYSARIEYRCNAGYRLEGSATLTCMEDGRWSAPAPICLQATCPQLQKPDYGSVTLLGNTYSSIATYRCDKGYRLSGVDARTCQADGTWSDRAPSCLATTCPAPRQLANGRVEYKDLSVGATVRYQCDYEYTLVGDDVRRCQADFTLTGTDPICWLPDCGSVGQLENGHATFSAAGTRIGGVATFSCKPGYILEGNSTRTCEAIGAWSGKMPVCTPSLVQCKQVSEVISNGRANWTLSIVGSAVSYQCNEGYKIKGEKVRTCLASGDWDYPVPTCQKMVCPPLRLINGYLSSFDRDYGTVIKLSCNQNYHLIGPSERTCLGTGEWSGQESECKKINCPPPDPVANSLYKVLNESAITYKCETGFNLVGHPIRVCGPDKVWRPDPPYCRRATCQDLSQVAFENGQVNFTSNKVGDFVSYSCNQGYKLKGESRRRCLPGGLWDGAVPSCEKVSCGHPGHLFNGKVRGIDYTFGSIIELSCETGFALVGKQSLLCQSNGRWEDGFPLCERVMCPEFQDILHGKVEVSSRVVFSTAKYMCDIGYRLEGKGIRECLTNGTWSGLEPVCVSVFCQSPDDVSHATMDVDSLEYGAIVSYTCSEGYELEGPSSRVCVGEGTWSDDSPTCLPVLCPEPAWIDHGFFQGDSSSYGAVLSYGCEEGYRLMGNSERVCQADATWSGHVPECQKVSCGPPPAIDNAVVDQTDNYLYDATVRYLCEIGYLTSGTDQITCLANGTWSATDFKCTIISCPAISGDDLPHVVVHSPSFTYGSVVQFQCEVGYTLSGSSQTVCTAAGTWDSDFPTCKIVQCPVLTAPSFGSVSSSSNDYGSRANFTCNIGYNLLGRAELECLASGQWSHLPPTCQIVSCPAPPLVIPHGQVVSPKSESVYKEQVVYSCEQGYEPVGEIVLTCLETGLFDHPPPSCSRIPCPVPDSIEFGQYIVHDDVTVEYVCQSGYELVGKSTLTCLLGGQWSGLAPVCPPVICPTPLPVENGHIDGDDFTYGRIITYRCDAGYLLTGHPTRACQADRTWNYPSPQCLPISCGQPPEPFPKGSISGNFTFNSFAHYNCIPGFTLEGVGVRRCKADGTWDGQVPRCVRMSCPPPAQIDYGVITGQSYLFQDSVTYSCQPGYELRGSAVRVCESTLLWSGLDPVCVRISCGVPSPPLYGYIEGTSHLFGDQVSVFCNHGYRIRGSAHKLCEAGGAWSGADTWCEQVFCPPPPHVQHCTNNASTTGVSLTMGVKVTYQGVRGHFVNGAGEKICEPSGQWSNNLFTCDPVSCPEIKSIANGVVTGTAYTYLSLLNFSCNNGFELVGLSSLQCQDTGKWSSDVPVCSVISCPSFPIKHGYSYMNTSEASSLAYNDRKEGQHIFGDTIRLGCNEGYQLSGPASSQCLISGHWSNLQTTCELVTCPQPSGIDNALFSPSPLTYSSTVTVRCVSGYSLIGDPELRCGSDGRWAAIGVLPRCEQLQCGSPPQVDNAFILGDRFRQGDAIAYLCKKGYKLTGLNILTCGPSSTWQGSLPMCVAVDCGTPPVLPGGKVTLKTGSALGAEAQGSCFRGFLLQGVSTLTCEANGRWKVDPDLRCSPVDCGAPPDITHGSPSVSNTTLGSVVVYSCDSGYFLARGSSVLCDADGTWGQDLPTCSPIDCLDPPDVAHATYVSNGTLHGAVALYTCSLGFKFVDINANSFVCDESGLWQGTEPECEIITCGTPPLVDHAHYRLDNGHTYLSHAVYFCDQDYKVSSGDTSLTCGESGVWMGDSLVCTIITCPEPEAKLHSIVEYSSLTLGSVAVVTCDQGYSSHQAKTTLVCEPGGAWSSDTPTCSQILCSNPPGIAHARITLDTGRSVMSNVTYNCIRGFRMVNDDNNELTIFCGQDGDWAGKIPSCEPVLCPPPPLVPHSTQLTNGSAFSSVALYTCDLGYRMQGEPTLSCDHTGQWTPPSPPLCLPFSCGPPADMPSASYVGSAFTFGASVIYVCDPGHEVSGLTTSVCGSNGKWSPVNFNCTVRTCPPVPAPLHGVSVPHTVTPLVVGSVVTFTCDDEYTLVGPASLRCDKSGQWDSSPPLCQRIIDLCTETLAMNHTHPPPPGKLPGDIIVIRCHNGYTPQGNMTSVCLPDGTWTLPSGSCDKISCGRPTVSNPQHVVLRGHRYQYEDTVAFACRYGYSPVQSPPVITCLATGQWDSQPDCVAHCKQECLNGGHCLGFNRCKCMPGWGGPRCESAICILPCLHGGHCVAPYQCQCPQGYEGTRCHKATCARPCENGGRCLWPNKCQCPHGFHGNFCENVNIGYKHSYNGQ